MSEAQVKMNAALQALQLQRDQALNAAVQMAAVHASELAKLQEEIARLQPEKDDASNRESSSAAVNRNGNGELNLSKR